MPGPAPKPSDQRRRRNPAPQTRKLPAKGRIGDPPAWPLDEISESELAVWTELWRTPQAAAWEELGWHRTVARYCRVVVEAEARKAPATTRHEASNLEDRLGLNPMSMLRLRWEIAPDELAEKREESDSKRRLRAVDGAVKAKPAKKVDRAVARTE